MPTPLMIDSIDAAVDHVLDSIPGAIVLGIPLGVGKPNPFVNALYRRIKGNPARRLKIITALSLEIPAGKSDLERAFLGPLVERVGGGSNRWRKSHVSGRWRFGKHRVQGR